MIFVTKNLNCIRLTYHQMNKVPNGIMVRFGTVNNNNSNLHFVIIIRQNFNKVSNLHIRVK